MSIKLGTVAVVAAICFASSASAASCTINTVKFSLDGASASQCGYGTDVGADGIVSQNKAMFGMSGWIMGQTTSKQSLEGAQSQIGYNGVTFASVPTANKNSGSWSLDGYTGYGPLMIVLKAGRKMSAFLLDDMESLAGFWSTGREVCKDNVCKTVGFKLKHASVYYNPQPVPSQVPVPAAGFLLLAGLAGLVGLRRARKTT